MRKILAAFLSILCLHTVSFALNETNVSPSHDSIYLSQEEVFFALAESYQDQAFNHFIRTKDISDLSSDVFSQFTNEEYGGMYLDDNGTLVLCFTDGSPFLMQTKVESQSILENLSNDTKQQGIRNVQVKNVSYSEPALRSLMDFLGDHFNDGNVISHVSLDTVNNQVKIKVIAPELIDVVQDALSHEYDPEMFTIEAIDAMSPKMVPIANIDSTTKVRGTNLYGGVTVAGNLYISSIHKLVAVTCAHSLTVGERMYVYNTGVPFGTVIGQKKFILC